MPRDPQPLDYEAARAPPPFRPTRLIHQSYTAAGLCLFAAWVDVATRFGSARVSLILALLSFYGLAVAIASFVRGELLSRDRLLLGISVLICVISAAWSVLSPRIVH